MINIGILGTNFGRTHAEIYKRLEGLEVKKIFGRNRELLKQINNELNISITTDIENIISDPDIDLVDICLPSELHEHWVIKALENGKDVFCETPLSLCLESANKIMKVSNETGKSVFIDLFYKFSTPHKYAIDLIKNNELGDILSFSSYNKTSKVWGDLSLDNNIISFFIHNYDFLTEVAQSPTMLFAMGKDGPGISSLTSIIQYNDFFATITSNSNLPSGSPFKIGFEIVCQNGSIEFDARFGEETTEFLTITRNNKTEKLDLEVKDDYEEVIKHIRYCLTNNVRSKSLDIKNAIEVLKLIDASRESLANNKVVSLIKT